MKKILIAINFDEGLYNFRKELLERLLAEGYEVHVAAPLGEFSEKLTGMGCILHDTPLSRRGKNPFAEISLLRCYSVILKSVRPDVVLTYTIKPNVYLGFLCGHRNVPFITTITGLGTAVEGSGLLQRFTKALYRRAMKHARIVFFQNKDNEELFLQEGIADGRHRMLPGSGVNLTHFAYREFPVDDGQSGYDTKAEFLFISRVMEEKGIEQFLDTAETIKAKYPHTTFRILGFLEDDYTGAERLKRLADQGIVIFEGSVADVRPYIAASQCTLHPSFYPEGMSNVCLETAASGRAVITTDRPGCRDTIVDGETGLLIKERDSADLIQKVENFLQMSYDERKAMGRKARSYMEEHYDRRIVVERYLQAIREITD